MILTFQFAPIWISFVAVVTFLVLQRLDPVDLSQYKERMYGIPAAVCCSSIMLPFAVLFLYALTMKFGPKVSKVGLKI